MNKKSVIISKALLVAMLFVSWLPLIPAAAAEGAAPAIEESKFVQVTRDEFGYLKALQTAVVKYRLPVSLAEVSLIAVIHVGEENYFSELNEHFLQYDSLLYELIAPSEEAAPLAEENSAHPVSVLQVLIKDSLALSFQLDLIDYEKPNFVHADMSQDEFAESMRTRNESFAKIFLRLFMASYAKERPQNNPIADIALLIALLNDNRALTMKRLMAVELEKIDVMTEILGGAQGSTIITERNKKALSVLKKELSAGKKRLGIFYGAGHMPDLEQQLIADFKAEKLSHEWLNAWDLSGRKASAVK